MMGGGNGRTVDLSNLELISDFTEVVQANAAEHADTSAALVLAVPSLSNPISPVTHTFVC